MEAFGPPEILRVPGGWDLAMHRAPPARELAPGRELTLPSESRSYDGDGEFSGPVPLLLLHGFTGSARSWPVAQVDRLARQRKVLAFDLPGHGSSTVPPEAVGASFESVVDDLAWALGSAELGRVDLLGYSMGGRTALGLAVRHPDRVRNLILESASPGLATADARTARLADDRALAGRILAQGLERFVEQWEALPLFDSHSHLDDETKTRLRETRMANDPAGLAWSLRVMGTGAQPSYWAEIGGVIRPTLILTGGLDGKFEAIGDRMAQALPHPERLLVPGCGHTPHLEAPKAWGRGVEEFLAHRDAHPVVKGRRS
jgi:2-succinyl-6-hydroxy-2,4-cyclohexadiene-1-carboxylate synthase